MIALGCPADDGETDDGADSTSGASSSTSPTTTSPTTTASTSTSPTSTSASTTVDPSTGEVTTTTDGTDTDDPSETETDTQGVGCDACGPGEYCDYPVNSCGTGGFDEGVCTPIPDGCPAVEEDPVCACDGVVYSGECAAALLGVDVALQGGCTPPPDTFECGYKYCDPALSYCQWSVSDVGGYPDGWACVPLPEACGDTPGCECLADEPCAMFACEPTDDGGLLITCPGG